MLVGLVATLNENISRRTQCECARRRHVWATRCLRAQHVCTHTQHSTQHGARATHSRHREQAVRRPQTTTTTSVPKAFCRRVHIPCNTPRPTHKVGSVRAVLVRNDCAYIHCRNAIRTQTNKSLVLINIKFIVDKRDMNALKVRPNYV